MTINLARYLSGNISPSLSDDHVTSDEAEVNIIDSYQDFLVVTNLTQLYFCYRVTVNSLICSQLPLLNSICPKGTLLSQGQGHHLLSAPGNYPDLVVHQSPRRLVRHRQL